MDLRSVDVDKGMKDASFTIAVLIHRESVYWKTSEGMIKCMQVKRSYETPGVMRDLCQEQI